MSGFDRRDHTRAAAAHSVLRIYPALPEACSTIERALLRGRLIDLCLRWGDAYHRQYHTAHSIPIDACKLRPNDVAGQTWRDWSDPPDRSFERWAQAYVHQFSKHHPQYSITLLKDALDHDPTDTTSLRRVAHEMGVSVRSLRRKFQKITGTTVWAYQTRRRVERAVVLLQHTDGKVQAIANDLGWANRKELLEAVRKATGLTPSQIRARKRSE